MTIDIPLPSSSAIFTLMSLNLHARIQFSAVSFSSDCGSEWVLVMQASGASFGDQIAQSVTDGSWCSSKHESASSYTSPAVVREVWPCSTL